MIVYTYDGTTGEYVGTETADESPNEPGVHLIPAHATATEPPKPRKGYVRVFRDGRWVSVADPRGTYYLPSGAVVTVTDLRDTVPDGATREAPARPLDAVRADVIDAVNSAHAVALRAATGDATPEERDTWPVKAEAARAYIQGDASDPQSRMLVVEAETVGEDVTALAQYIVATDAKFKILVGRMSGVRRMLTARALAATTLAELQSVAADADSAFTAAV